MLFALLLLAVFSKYCFNSFRSRWRYKLGFRVANKMAKNRAKSVTKQSLEAFYSMVETQLNKLDLYDKPQFHSK